MLYVQRREEGVEHQLIMSNYGLLVCVVPGNSAAYPKDIPDAGLKTRVCQNAGSVRDIFRYKPCDQYLVSPLVTQGLIHRSSFGIRFRCYYTSFKVRHQQLTRYGELLVGTVAVFLVRSSQSHRQEDVPKFERGPAIKDS